VDIPVSLLNGQAGGRGAGITAGTADRGP
jgi:hypothetical protein